MATIDNDAMMYCEGCKKTKKAKEFYGSKNLEKYPEGKLHKCKECITRHVDNWDSSTYLWILQEMDVPYIPDEWNKLMINYAKDRSKVTGATILGRYASKMKLKQYKDFRWADTEYLQEVKDKETEETMKRQGYSAVEISKALLNQQISLPEKIEEPEFADLGQEIPRPDAPQIDDYFSQQVAEFADNSIVDELTDDDKRYLIVKWGKSYCWDELVQLEKLYEEMMQSYDIQSAGHIDTLKMICKTSLKANQLLDYGD